MDEIKGRSWFEDLSFVGILNGGKYNGHLVFILFVFSRVVARKKFVVTLKHYDENATEKTHQLMYKLDDIEWDNPNNKISGVLPNGSFFRWAKP